jgi:hypothetical protein
MKMLCRKRVFLLALYGGASVLASRLSPSAFFFNNRPVIFLQKQAEEARRKTSNSYVDAPARA